MSECDDFTDISGDTADYTDLCTTDTSTVDIAVIGCAIVWC